MLIKFVGLMGTEHENQDRRIRNPISKSLALSVQKAKTKFYQCVIDEIQKSKDILRVAKRTRTSQKFVSATMRNEDGDLVEETEEKIDLWLHTRVVHDNQENRAEAPTLPAGVSGGPCPLKKSNEPSFDQ